MAASSRIMLRTVCVVCAADWALKAARELLWSGWVAHAASPPAWWLTWMLPGAWLLARALPFPAGPVAAGLFAGGAVANGADAWADGVAWNMLPVPGTDWWCNAADVAIVSGLLGLTAAVIAQSLSRPSAA